MKGKKPWSILKDRGEEIPLGLGDSMQTLFTQSAQGKKKEITVGVFFALITSKGKVRLRMRTEQGSMFGKNVSYTGVFELPGGGAEEKDLSRILTSDVLFKEGHRETIEEIGVVVKGLPMNSPIYRTVYKFPNGEKEDWAFMIAIPPENWDENAEMLQGVKTVDVDAKQLDALGALDLIVSGKKRMYRMAMAGIFLGGDRFFASGLLTLAKADWERTELFYNADEVLADFREELGVEDINASLSRGENL